MKKLVLVSFVFLVSISFFGFVTKKNKIVNQSEFCNDFVDGYSIDELEDLINGL